MYRSKQYRERSLSDIVSDIKKCEAQGLSPEKVFLCDGDALGAPQELLLGTLQAIKKLLPNTRRVGVYATAENILEKSDAELSELKENGLEIAYLGLESGDDDVLHMIVKGNSAQEMLDASLKIKAAGIRLSTIAMLGVGGKKYSKEHVKNTAKLISATSPHFLSFLTTFAVPGTPYHKMIKRGLIAPLTSYQLLKEMHDIINLSEFPTNRIIFRANHVSNSRPLGGTLPEDKTKILETIRNWLEDTPQDVYPTPPKSM
jgi:radical SAM superfamily enzyme YgiQ (UPF0313 family)